MWDFDGYIVRVFRIIQLISSENVFSQFQFG